MRVISGSARGRKLKEPENYDIRPTMDQVKEAIFNICQFDIEGRRVLDLFGGTGQLGIEAASRGAAGVDIVDHSREAVALIRQNVALTGLECRVIQGDSIAYLAGGEKYDLIFIDPPYDSGLVEKALETVKRFDNLTDGGIIMCETCRERNLPAIDTPYIKQKEYNYGKVKLTKYIKQN